MIIAFVRSNINNNDALGTHTLIESNRFFNVILESNRVVFASNRLGMEQIIESNQIVSWP